MSDSLSGIKAHGPGTYRPPPQSATDIIDRAKACVERESDALALVLDRAEIRPSDLDVTRSVLRKLALVELDDLKVAPGFELLADGSVGSANTETTEWQYWRTAQDLVEDANHLEIALSRAYYRTMERAQ